MGLNPRHAHHLGLAAVLAIALGAQGARADETERYQPASRGPRAAVQDLVDAHFAPEWAGWAMRTAACETGGTFDLYAHSAGFDRRWGVFYDFWGPFQVDAVTWSATAWELFGGHLSDPDVGAAMAAWILDQYGPGHWPVCGRR